MSYLDWRPHVAYTAFKNRRAEWNASVVSTGMEINDPLLASQVSPRLLATGFEKDSLIKELRSKLPRPAGDNAPQPAAWTQDLKDQLKDPGSTVNRTDNPLQLKPRSLLEKTVRENWNRARSKEAFSRLSGWTNEPEPDFTATEQLSASELEIVDGLLATKDVIRKANDSESSLQLITAVLQQVTGVYTIEQLPATSRKYITQKSQLHRVEAEQILHKVNQQANAALRVKTIGSEAADPRVAWLIDEISRNHGNHEFDIQILSPTIPAQNSFKFDHAVIPRAQVPNKIYGILQIGDKFEAITLSPPLTNPKLNHTYYEVRKSRYRKFKTCLNGLYNRERIEVQHASDTTLLRNLEGRKRDPAADKKNESLRAFDARNKGKATPPPTTWGSWLPAVGGWNARATPRLSAVEVTEYKKKLKEEHDRAANGEKRQFTNKELHKMREALKKEARRSADAPATSLPIYDDSISVRAALEKARKEALEKQTEDVPNHSPAKLIPVIPAAKPLATKLYIDGIVLKFDAYFEAAGKNSLLCAELVNDATTHIHKAKVLFYQAIEEGDISKIELAKKSVRDAISLLRVQAVGADGTDSTQNSASPVPVTPSNETLVPLPDSDEMLLYHRRNFMDFGVADTQIDGILVLEKTCKSDFEKNTALFVLRKDIGNDAAVAAWLDKVTDDGTKEKFEGELVDAKHARQTALAALEIAQAPVQAGRTGAQVAATARVTPATANTAFLAAQKAVALAKHNLGKFNSELEAAGQSGDRLEASISASKTNLEKIEKLKKLSEREAIKDIGSLKEFVEMLDEITAIIAPQVAQGS